MATVAIAKNKKLNQKIRAFVAQIVLEVLADPDLGLHLSTKAKRRLAKANASKEVLVSLADIKKRLA